MLNEEQQGLLAFLESSKLTAAQITGSTEFPQSTEYPVALVVRWPYKEGTSFVLPEIVHVLPTQIRRLHD